MNVCITVEEDRGLESPVCAHLASAPLFLMVDSDTGACRTIVNDNGGHGNGPCRPTAAIDGENVGLLVVGGIGRGALDRLAASGIPVRLAEGATAADVMRAYRAGTLREVPAGSVRCLD